MDRGGRGEGYARSGRCVTALLLGALWLGGCDDHSSDPPPPDPTPKELPQFKHPTTQQLLSGPTKVIPLLAFPLTIEVPNLPVSDAKSPQWMISSTAGDASTGLWIEGPSPAGDIMIQMSTLPDIPNAPTLSGIENYTRKEAAAHPGDTLLSDIRMVGPIKVIEQRTLRHIPAQDVDGPKPGSRTGEVVRTHVPASDEVEWTIRLFIPKGKQFTTGTLTFIGLSKEQYEADKAFLDKLVGSLRYDGTKGELP